MQFIKKVIPKVFMLAKMQANTEDSSRSPPGILKKVYCPEHGDKYVLRCKYPTCEAPFICSHFECIQNHIHESEEVQATRFDSDKFLQNFKKAQNIMNLENIQHSARTMRKFVDQLKSNLRHVYTNLKVFNQTKDQLQNGMEVALTPDFIYKINLTCELQSSLKKDLQTIQAKINMIEPIKQKQFFLKEQLNQFLESSIEGFDWQKTQEVYSTKDQLLTCQKFHQKFQGKSKLVFLFISDDKIAGSYYSQAYPNLKERTLKDDDSFIFITTGGQQKQGKTNPIEFTKFHANKSSAAHMLLSHKNYIQHGSSLSLPEGMRTFQKSLDLIDVNLPSNSYICTQEIENIDTKLKVKYFMVLHIRN